MTIQPIRNFQKIEPAQSLPAAKLESKIMQVALKALAFIAKVFTLLLSWFFPKYFAAITPIVEPKQTHKIEDAPAQAEPVEIEQILTGKISPKEMQALGREFFKQFNSVVQKANQERANGLYVAMQSAGVDQKVIQSMKDEGLSLFGEDVANGSAYLSPAMRDSVINYAKNKSNLEALKAYLLGEIQSGKFISPVAEYKRFAELNKDNLDEMTPDDKKKWTQDYKSILNLIICKHEIQKIIRKKKTIAGGMLENFFLEKCGLGSASDMVLRQKRHEGEVALLTAHLKANCVESEEIEKIQEELNVKKMIGRIEASGVSSKDAVQYANFILNMEKAQAKMLKELEPEMQELPDISADYQPAAKKQRLAALRNRMLRDLEKATHLILSRVAKKDVSLRLSFMAEGTVDKLVEEYQKLYEKHKLIQKAKNFSKRVIDFDQKWKERLVGELIQGQDDEQEVFVQGVCHAISLRWVKNEFDHIDQEATMFQNPALFSVQPIDRILQASYVTGKHHTLKMARDPSQTTLAELDFNPFIRNKTGIKAIKDFVVPGLEKAEIKRELEGTDTTNSHGVFMVGLFFKESGAHSVYLRYDRERQIFHVGDPNIGIFKLKDEAEFFEFYGDLLDWYNEEMTATSYSEIIPSKAQPTRV